MSIGCNALYPWPPLKSSDMFGVAAYRTALANLAEAGFEAVEFSHLYHLSEEDVASIGGYAHSLGLACWSCHAEGPAGFDLAADAVAMGAVLCRCLDLCAAAGGQVLVVHAPFGAASPDLGIEAEVMECLSRDRAALEPACRRAEALGVRVALENLSTAAQMQYIVRLRDSLGADCLGFCVDTGHAALHDLGPARAVRMAGARLFTTHLQDNHGVDDEHLPPGRGEIDWPDVFTALEQVEYRGTLMLELTDSPSGRPYDQRQELAEGAAAVRRLSAGLTLPR